MIRRLSMEWDSYAAKACAAPNPVAYVKQTARLMQITEPTARRVFQRCPQKSERFGASNYLSSLRLRSNPTSPESTIRPMQKLIRPETAVMETTALRKEYLASLQLCAAAYSGLKAVAREGNSYDYRHRFSQKAIDGARHCNSESIRLEGRSTATIKLWGTAFDSEGLTQAISDEARRSIGSLEACRESLNHSEKMLELASEIIPNFEIISLIDQRRMTSAELCANISMVTVAAH